MIAAIYARKSVARYLRILLALLGLLVFTTSASAECAWMLWGMITGPAAMWQPGSAFNTRELCVAHMSVASPGFVGKTVNTVAGSMDRGEAAYTDQAGRSRSWRSASPTPWTRAVRREASDALTLCTSGRIVHWTAIGGRPRWPTTR